MSFSRPLEVDGVTFDELEVDILELFGEGYRGIIDEDCASRRGFHQTRDDAERPRKRYAENKKYGICTICKGKKTLGGATKCAGCITKQANLDKQRYEDRKAAGRCQKCTAQSVEGKTRCQRHLDAMKAAREKRKQKKAA